MLKKSISLFVVVAIMISVFVGWGGSYSTAAQKPVKLIMTYWQPENKDIMEKMNEKFTQQNKNITIELQQIPGDQYDKVLQTRFLSDNAPDVVFYYATRIFELAQKGQIGEITNEPYVKNIGEAYKTPAVWKGKLYGVPMNTWASCVIYNKKAFQQAGITKTPKKYSEFLADCEKIKKAGVIPIARGGKDQWTGSVEMLSLYGCTIANKYPDVQADRYNGKFKFVNSPYFKKYLDRYIELVDKGYIDKGCLGLNHSQAAQQVADGRAAMMLGISVFWGDILANNKDADLGIFMLPDEDGSYAFVAGPDKGICYAAHGKNIEAAKKVMAFYATPKTDKMFCDATQMLPCLNGANVALAKPLKALGKELEGVKDVFIGIDFPWPPAATDAFRTAIQGIHAGEKDVNKILSDIDKAYDNNINTITAPITK